MSVVCPMPCRLIFSPQEGGLNNLWGLTSEVSTLFWFFWRLISYHLHPTCFFLKTRALLRSKKCKIQSTLQGAQSVIIISWKQSLHGVHDRQTPWLNCPDTSWEAQKFTSAGSPVAMRSLYLWKIKYFLKNPISHFNEL